jgi:hypothetical protein
MQNYDVEFLRRLKEYQEKLKNPTTPTKQPIITIKKKKISTL